MLLNTKETKWNWCECNGVWARLEMLKFYKVVFWFWDKGCTLYTHHCIVV